jgi:hypothetical protein
MGRQGGITERFNEEGWDSDDDGGLLIGGPSPRLVVGNC